MQCILFFTVSMCVESASKEQTLTCQETEDSTLECSFSVEKEKKEDVQLEFCNADYCLQAVVTKKDVVERAPVKDSAAKEQVITVGSREYKAPYSQYGKRVGRVLQTYPQEDPTTVENMMEYANWLVDLGKAFRDDAATLDNVVDWENVDMHACIQAFDLALALYKQVIDHYPTDARLSLATVQSYLAEAHQSHPSNPQTKEAIRYYLDSQQNYKVVLESNALKEFEYEDWELNWADVLAHAALLLIEDVSVTQADEHAEDVLDISHTLEVLKKAERMLEDAIRVFRKTISNLTGNDQIFYQLQLATCLQNMGTAIMMTSTIGRAIVVLEESRTIFQEVFPKLTKESLERQDTALAIAELLITLSDAYLQVGNYDHSKIHYQQAMQWYSDYNLDPPKQTVLITESDELLQETEAKLEEYQASLYGGRKIQIPDDYRKPNEPLYEPDNLYEADLHATIGAIQLSNGQAELAMTSFVKAIDLYESHKGEERAIADVKLNMGMALFRLREFDESARLHGEALELFREFVGEGKNPLVDGTVSTNSGTDIENEDNVVRSHLVNLDDFRQSLANVTSNDEL